MFCGVAPSVHLGFVDLLGDLALSFSHNGREANRVVVYDFLLAPFEVVRVCLDLF